VSGDRGVTATVTDLPPRLRDRITVSAGVPSTGSRPLDTPCWLWTGGKFSAGYGSVWWNGSGELVHRVVYDLLVGPLPDRQALLWIDHVCRMRACCNPDHLELVTATDNQLRRADVMADICSNGHPWDDNARPVPGKPNQRRCRTCAAERQRRYRARLRAAR
jgi:hypothetical protein